MNKSTQELIEMMRKSRNYDEYRQANQEDMSRSFMEIDRALAVLLNEKGLKKSDVIAKSGIEIHYAYQIFSGAKTPTRDKVVMLCFGFGLSIEEAQQLLKITGYSQLYVKNERESAILYGLEKQMSVVDVNNLLYDLGCDLLT